MVSKSEDMGHATLKLFSGLHVNGSLDRLIDEFHASLLWGHPLFSNDAKYELDFLER